jgi:hypothetical protein
MAKSPSRKQQEMSEGIKVLAKATVDNMLFLKRQQWSITNYALLLDAAVMALARGSNDIERTIYTVLAFGGCVFAMFCVNHTQTSLTRYYGNLFDLYQRYLTPAERETYKTVTARPAYGHNGMFIFGLFLVNMVAFGVAFYVIWFRGGLGIPFGECKCPTG